MRRVCSLALLLSGLFVFGQMNTGEISGNVRDLSNSVLPGATVVAQQAETRQTFTTVSNNSGEYLFAQLPLGVYSMSVSSPNFKQSALPRIEVHASDRLRRDFTLELGDRTEVVTVLADARSVQLESAEIRDVIGRQQVVDLPVKDVIFSI
jgi:hypothetical protein